METSKDRILEALELHSQGLCDDCLSKIADVRPRQQVNQICRPLAAAGVVRRDKDKCPQCGTWKFVNRVGEPSRLALIGAERRDNASWDATATLKGIHLSLVKILDQFDKPVQREGLAARISRLRDTSRIPSLPACMMLTLNALRNIAVHEDQPLGVHEKGVVISAWASVQEWSKTIL